MNTQTSTTSNYDIVDVTGGTPSTNHWVNGAPVAGYPWHPQQSYGGAIARLSNLARYCRLKSSKFAFVSA
jgi:hypothetical protein